MGPTNEVAVTLFCALALILISLSTTQSGCYLNLPRCSWYFFSTRMGWMDDFDLWPPFSFSHSLRFLTNLEGHEGTDSNNLNQLNLHRRITFHISFLASTSSSVTNFLCRAQLQTNTTLTNQLFCLGLYRLTFCWPIEHGVKLENYQMVLWHTVNVFRTWHPITCSNHFTTSVCAFILIVTSWLSCQIVANCVQLPAADR